MRRRAALTLMVGGGFALLLGWYVVYSQRVVSELRQDAARSSRMFARVYAGITAPDEGAAYLALVELTQMIREAGVPVIATDPDGNPTAQANLPFDAPLGDPRVRAYVAVLDAQNTPVTEPTLGTTIHYGFTPLVRGLRVIPMLQVASLGLLLAAGVVLLLTHGRAERDRVWAGMARESAHQIGTPLSSLHGWTEVLRERAGDPLMDQAIDHMRGDLERLERVAHRFERIGRPPKRDAVDVRSLVHRVVDYFRARVPTLATPVRLEVDIPGDGLTVTGDRVLLEWVLESLIKNAIDALSGIGGTITVRAETVAGDRVRVRVADDGPGVPPALRRRIFDPGFTTKERGWGIGLALTRRIVEENHGGKLLLLPTAKGAAFDVILPA